MLFVLMLLFIAYVVFKKGISKREYLFFSTLIFSCFLFDSADPFIGIPLYFYLMCFSIIVSLFERNDLNGNQLKKFTFISIILIFSLILQIINVLNDFNIIKVLLIKDSNTDTMDVASQLFYPSFDFTMIKHFIFLIVYLLFIMFNIDILQDKKTYAKLFNIFDKSFHFLFICIIIEFIIVNILNGYNDRLIMSILFNFKNLNMKENWMTFGVYTVSFCFSERSTMAIIIIYYMMHITKKDYNIKFLIWLAISLISSFATGSTTSLVIVILFGLFILIDIIYCKTKIITKTIIILIMLISITIIIINYEILFEKLNQFLSNNQEWGSAYFRKQSLEYAIQAINFSPLIGIGIGTVYCHGALIQTLSNIGFIGLFLLILTHIVVIPKFKFNLTFIYKLVCVIFVSFAAFMLQQVTSPVLLCFMICLSSMFSQCNRKEVFNENLVCNNKL